MKRRRIKAILSLIILMVGISLLQLNTSATEEFQFDSVTKTITGYSGNASSIVIPESIGGVAVEVIGSKAFSNNQNLREVTIANSVKIIKSDAFGRSGLSVHFPMLIPNLEKIEANAFNSAIAYMIIPGLDPFNQEKTIEVGAGNFFNSSYIMVLVDNAETLPSIPNLPVNYRGDKVKTPYLRKSLNEAGEALFSDQGVDLREYITADAWTITSENYAQPWLSSVPINSQFAEGARDKTYHDIFNVPTVADESGEIYKDIHFYNDTTSVDVIGYNPPVLAYIQNNRFFLNGQKMMLEMEFGMPRPDFGYIGSPVDYILANYMIEDSLKIDELPTKLTYYEGECFDPSGLIMGLETRQTGLTRHLLKYDELGEVAFNFKDKHWDPDMLKIPLTADMTEMTFSVQYDDYALGIFNMYNYDKKFQIPITVKEIKAEVITINRASEKTVYYEGEKFDPTGLELAVHNNNGTDENIVYSESTKDLFAFSIKQVAVGDTQVDITYDGQTVSQIIEVNPVVTESISITNGPTKVKYFEGEVFDPTGLIIEVLKNNGTTEAITYDESTKDLFQFSVDLLTISNNDITITYDQKIVNQSIEVKAVIPESISIKKQPKTEYYEGDIFDPTGLIIEVKMNNGTIKDITYNTDTQSFFSFSLGQLSINDNKIKVMYNQQSTDIDISVIELKDIDFTIKQNPIKTEYIEEEIFDPTGLIIEIIMNNGKTKDIVYNETIKDLFNFNISKLTLKDTSVNVVYNYMVSKNDNQIKVTVLSKYVEKILENKQEHIFLDGIFTRDAKMIITKMDTQNPLMMNKDKDKKVLQGFEVNIDGKFQGEIGITFSIDTRYNGKQVYIKHLKQDGSIEEFKQIVENGKIKITVNELSPFIILVDQVDITVPIIKDNVPSIKEEIKISYIEEKQKEEIKIPYIEEKQKEENYVEKEKVVEKEVKNEEKKQEIRKESDNTKTIVFALIGITIVILIGIGITKKISSKRED